LLRLPALFEPQLTRPSTFMDDGVAMRTLICPISPLRIDETTARITALLIVVLLVLYLVTGTLAFVGLAIIDYAIRAFTSRRSSVVSWVAARIARGLGAPPRPIDKAPKIFAARVGVLFASATLGLCFVNVPSSMVVGTILIGCALLESLLNVCIGCLVYTYIVLPRFTAQA
jgi:hypothetical protein